MHRLARAALGASFGLALVGGPLLSPAAAVVAHAPRIRLSGGGGTVGALGWTSSNWSGYAVTGSSLSSVTGAWTVPTVTRSRKSTYSASWAGIDGFNNSSLIQAGTGQDYSGSASYYAWWEILPAPETRISSMTIRPGDKVSVNIHRVSGSSWSIAVSDSTTGQSFTTTQTYTGPGASAEWIEEAPTVGGRQATIANYGRTTFDPGTVNGGNPHLKASDGGALVQHGSQVSTPSNPDSDTDGFAIAYGSTAPAAPAS